MFDDLSNEELRKQIAEFQRKSAPPAHTQPDAPGCEKLSDAARETARSLFGESIMRKKADEITPADHEFLRKSVLAALEGLKQMPDPIDGQIDALLADYAREEQERAEQQAEALHERLEMRKASLLARRWKPLCTCRQNLRAILKMDPSQACPHSCQWWK
jgi:hypothetical protein